MVNMVVLRGIYGSEFGIEPSKVTTRQIAGKVLSEFKDTDSALATLSVKGAKLAAAVLTVAFSIGYIKGMFETHDSIITHCNITSAMEVFEKEDCIMEPILCNTTSAKFFDDVNNVIFSDATFAILKAKILEEFIMFFVEPVIRNEKARFSFCKDINDSKIESCVRGVLNSLATALVPPQCKPFMILCALNDFKNIVSFNNK